MHAFHTETLKHTAFYVIEGCWKISSLFCIVVYYSHNGTNGTICISEELTVFDSVNVFSILIRVDPHLFEISGKLVIVILKFMNIVSILDDDTVLDSFTFT